MVCAAENPRQQVPGSRHGAVCLKWDMAVGDGNKNNTWTLIQHFRAMRYDGTPGVLAFYFSPM